MCPISNLNLSNVCVCECLIHKSKSAKEIKYKSRSKDHGLPYSLSIDHRNQTGAVVSGRYDNTTSQLTFLLFSLNTCPQSHFHSRFLVSRVPLPALHLNSNPSPSNPSRMQMCCVVSISRSSLASLLPSSCQLVPVTSPSSQGQRSKRRRHRGDKGSPRCRRLSGQGWHRLNQCRQGKV